MRFFLPFVVAVVLATAAQPLACAGGSAVAVLDEINFARTNPQQYARTLTAHSGGSRGIAETVSFLKKARPLPPLSFESGLASSAQVHVAEQGARGSIGHGNPFSRMSRFGHWTGRAGENISYGHADARSIVAQLIIDAGVPGRGHRKNIFNASFKVAGVACGGHARWGSMCVIDFAGGFESNNAATFAVSGASRAPRS